MKTVIAWLLCIGLILGGVTNAADADEFYLGGIQVNEPDHARWVEALQVAGMNSVSVTVYAHQGDWDTDHLWWAEEEPAVLEEIRAAKAAGLKVVLILRVAVDHAFARNKFIWHGMIMPRNSELIDSWFAQYTAFALKWAEVAEREGIDLLGIGSEMNALSATLPVSRFGNWKNYHAYYWYQRLSKRRARKFADQIEQKDLWVRGYENYDTLKEFRKGRFEHTVAWARQAYLRPGGKTYKRISQRRAWIDESWVELIRRVREVYGGQLTYGANFDNYRDVGFWSELDLIGINGYFPLRKHLNRELSDEEKREQFLGAWRSIFSDFESFREGQGLGEMPFLFTELGYTFRESSTVEPWAHGGFSVIGWGTSKRRLVVWSELPVNYDERRLAVEALREVHQERPGAGLSGILWWKLSTIEEHEEIEPFVLHVGAGSEDSLQETLRGFAGSSR